MNTDEIGIILSDVQARLKGLPEHVTNDAAFEARAAQIAKQIIDAEVANPNSEFVRKIRFGTDQKLVGSKFARHNLSISDVEFLYDIAVAE